MFVTSPKGMPKQGRPSSYRALFVTPSDSVNLPSPAVGFAATGAGNVSVQLDGGGTAVFTGLSAGQIVDLHVTRILATGTTATGVTALY